MGGRAHGHKRVVALSKASAERRLAAAMRGSGLLLRLREEARSSGDRLWVVGGWVRDTLLGLAPKDFDLVAEAESPAWLERWGGRGFRFEKRGVVTWRMQLHGREIDLVDASSNGFDADLKRRDLTINALAWELGSGRLDDRVGGLGDLARRRLRLPRPEVFDEDPLRALRLARFLARLPEFRAAPEAIAAARRSVRALGDVSVERVFHELDALLTAREPRPGLAALADWGLLEPLLPELLRMRECVAGTERPDVWTHTLLAIDQTRALRRRRLPFADRLDDPENRRVLHWALLLHDVSKPETLKRLPDGRPSFHGHETLGAERAQALLRRLRAPNELERRVERLVRLHLRPGHLADQGPSRRALARLVRDAEAELPLLVLHAASDALGSGARSGTARWNRLRKALAGLSAMAGSQPSKVAPLLDGRTVMQLTGIAPGPALGAVLRGLVEAQIAGEVEDEAAARRWLARHEGLDL